MIRSAVIGCGYWGPNLARNFSETPGSCLVGVADLDPKRLAVMKARYPGIRATTDHREILSDPGVDAVAISTPVRTHFALAMEALQAGKHVLVEKPMTMTSEEGERLVEAAEKADRTLMVDHTFVYTPAVRKLRELLDAGELGEVLYYDSVRINLGLFQHDVNVLWDLAVHDLSIMDFLVGRAPEAVSATGVSHFPGRPEDVAYLTCFFSGNLIGHCHVNWLSPVKIRRTVIGCSRRMAVYDDLEPSEKVRVYDKGVTLTDDTEGRYRLLVSYRTGDAWIPNLPATEALGVEIAHFLDCIRNRRVPLTDGQAGLRLVRMLEAASASLAQRGAPVNLGGR